MTIRTRIVAGVTVLAAVVFAMAGVITVVSLERQLVEEIDFEISVRVARAMDSFGRIPFGGLGPGTGEGIDRMFEKRDVAVILVPTEGPVTVIPAGSFEDPDPLPDIDTDSLAASEPFTVDAVEGNLQYRVAVHEVPGGHVVLAAGLDSVESAVAALAVNVSLIGAGAVLMAGFGTAGIVRRGMRPVDEMISTAERVGDGTLSERVKDTDPNTEVGHLGIAINNMLTRVEEAVAVREASEERLRRFASDASHELRNPLTSILGYAELYRRGGTAEHQVARSFERIEAEGARMARMVEDLLLLTRLDQGRGLEPAEVDLASLLAEVVEDARASEPERPITFAPPGIPVPITADGDRLRQVFGNLLANVRDHTPAGTPVHLTLEPGDPVRVTIRDEGPGIIDEATDTVFERFTRLSPAGVGSGLGLAIVRSIVEAHGGTVTLDGSKGTTVVVELGAEPRGSSVG